MQSFSPLSLCTCDLPSHILGDSVKYTAFLAGWREFQHHHDANTEIIYIEGILKLQRHVLVIRLRCITEYRPDTSTALSVRVLYVICTYTARHCIA